MVWISSTILSVIELQLVSPTAPKLKSEDKVAIEGEGAGEAYIEWYSIIIPPTLVDKLL